MRRTRLLVNVSSCSRWSKSRRIARMTWLRTASTSSCPAVYVPPSPRLLSLSTSLRAPPAPARTERPPIARDGPAEAKATSSKERNPLRLSAYVALDRCVVLRVDPEMLRQHVAKDKGRKMYPAREPPLARLSLTLATGHPYFRRFAPS
uniref:Uncharacterized protein n=1 Tax=Mycena chlorophos TaxID=658473 RepID=A0ABQ0LFE6_MYCCL|nr:predicted protein [Mycena chlorophos]